MELYKHKIKNNLDEMFCFYHYSVCKNVVISYYSVGHVLA